MDLKPGQHVRLVPCEAGDAEAFLLQQVDRSDFADPKSRATRKAVDLRIEPAGSTSVGWCTPSKEPARAAVESGDLVRIYGGRE